MVAGLPEYGDDPVKAAEHLRRFLTLTSGSVLRAWVKTFDPHCELRVSQLNFSDCMRALGYKGDVFRLFGTLDEDQSNELTLEEIGEEEAKIWSNFRSFAKVRFKSEDDMITTVHEFKNVSKGARKSVWAQKKKEERKGLLERRLTEKKLSSAGTNELKEQFEKLSRRDFCFGVANLGYGGDSDEINRVFDTLCERMEDGEDCITVDHLAWLHGEIQRHANKMAAKKWLRAKTAAGLLRKSSDNLVPEPPPVKEVDERFENFKKFLRRKCGNLIRAWRTVLTVNDNMVLSKTQFLKAAATLGFATEAKQLWKALDKDDSGSASIDELDPTSTEILASFKVWIDKKFGGARGAFEVMDVDSGMSIKQDEFENALKRFEFTRPCKLLFQWLDKHGTKKLSIDDIIFLDSWKPTEFLLADPNPVAKEEVKDLLLEKTGHFIKAWRQLLDKDGTNRCNWGDFREACLKLGYSGDLPGAWRSFDDDFSGWISLQEVDPDSSKMLTEFAAWAKEDFGSVANLYAVFDTERKNGLTFHEFRACLRTYGYNGPARILFAAFDLNQEGTVSYSEIKFLDDWKLAEKKENTVVHETLSNPSSDESQDEDAYSFWKHVDDSKRLRTVMRRKRQIEAKASMSHLPRSTFECPDIRGAEKLGRYAEVILPSSQNHLPVSSGPSVEDCLPQSHDNSQEAWHLQGYNERFGHSTVDRFGMPRYSGAASPMSARSHHSALGPEKRLAPLPLQSPRKPQASRPHSKSKSKASRPHSKSKSKDKQPKSARTPSLPSPSSRPVSRGGPKQIEEDDQLLGSSRAPPPPLMTLPMPGLEEGAEQIGEEGAEQSNEEFFSRVSSSSQSARAWSTRTKSSKQGKWWSRSWVQKLSPKEKGACHPGPYDVSDAAGMFARAWSAQRVHTYDVSGLAPYSTTYS
eukprot:TRINITY_DN33708_c0_g1_i1.p1 TRINITY_DN33708_c0_g1~~TRINITY_DN33708_c0_g1_i1.p1  ORF type:complete len:918 (+),score=195.75 TRINITY_DN33708_c0_g1_i1:80-2833(+)